MKLLILAIAALMLPPISCRAGESSNVNGVVSKRRSPDNADSSPVERTLNVMRDSRRQLYSVGYELRSIREEHGGNTLLSTSEFHRWKVNIDDFFDGHSHLKLTFTVFGWSTRETVHFPDATRWTLTSISKEAMLSKFRMESTRNADTQTLAALVVPFSSRVWAADNNTSPGQISHFGCRIECRLVEDEQLQFTIRGHRKTPDGELDRVQERVLKNIEEGMTFELVPGSKYKVRSINYGNKQKNIRGWIEIVRVKK